MHVFGVWEEAAGEDQAGAGTTRATTTFSLRGDSAAPLHRPDVGKDYFYFTRQRISATSMSLSCNLIKGSVSATEQCHLSEVNTPERQKVPEVRQTVNVFGELRASTTKNVIISNQKLSYS